MTSEQKASSLQEALPQIELLTPSSPSWSQRRETRGVAGQEHDPFGIAIPKDAGEVASLVKWAKTIGAEFSIRIGGNDFYGRYVVDGGLIIDMREIKSVEIAQDKETASIGGGIISKELVEKLAGEGLIAPFGNTWSVGYVGWATFGGYGPLTNPLGMGFEGIVGAEIVNAEGEVVQASDEMLEGVRGMGGNLGVITSMTIKVYPNRDLLSGMLMFDSSPETIKAAMATQAKLGIPKGLTIHNFVIPVQGRMFAMLFNWAGTDLEQGKKCLQSFTDALPAVKMNTVQQKTLIENYNSMQIPCLPFGGQRSIYLKELSPGVLDILMEARDVMPAWVNMGWSGVVEVDHGKTLPNCFGAGKHVFLSFNDMVPEEKDLPAAMEWSDRLFKRLRASGDPAVMEGSYAPLTRPTDRSTEQIFGGKWPRAKELKAKYDPSNVFKNAVPRL